MLRLTGKSKWGELVWDLPPGKSIVGRKSDCDFQLDDKTVSRHHTEILTDADDGSCHITDLESRNGTHINGRQAGIRARAFPGDIVTFGKVDFALTEIADDSITLPDISACLVDNDQIEVRNTISYSKMTATSSEHLADFPEFLAALTEMARQPVLAESQEESLKKLLSIVADIIPSECLAVLEDAGDKQHIYPVAFLSDEKQSIDSIALSDILAENILTHKDSIITGITPDTLLPENSDLTVAVKVKTAMAVPLISNGETRGILYADSGDLDLVYTAEHLQVMAVFGSIIAARMDNNNLLLTREDTVQNTLKYKWASKIQHNCLDREIPVMPGYQIHGTHMASPSVSCDFHDVTMLPDESVVFMVGDVTGHGIDAAVLMSHVLASFRAMYDRKSINLARAVKRVSNELYKICDTREFATLFIGRIKPGQTHVTYVNAGHIPPLMIRENGSAEYLGATGLPLGVSDNIGWGENIVDLTYRDTLLIRTDGITNSERNCQYFPAEKLEEIMIGSRRFKPTETAERIIREIFRFTGNTDPVDDITFLIIKRED
jgi:phosphoserine phosphatase RsbU/P